MKKKKLYYCSDNKCTSKSIFKDNLSHPEHPDKLFRIPKSLSKEYIFQKKLGMGTLGVVFRIYVELEEQKKVLKLIKVDEIEEINKEIKMLLLLDHPFIVKYFHSSFLKTKENNFVYILMEECELSLKEYLEEKKDKLNYGDRLNLLIQICQGINYIHHHEKVIIINLYIFYYLFNMMCSLF